MLGIISNGLGQFQNRAIDGLGIRDYFYVILISEIEQVRNPQPEIFQRAVNCLEVAAQGSVFIGDHLEADIMGAKNAEMKAIWKRNSHWLETKKADGTSDDLYEIADVLTRI